MASKRGRSEGEAATEPGSSRRFRVPHSGLEALGGEWAKLAPFEGDENELYGWISDPALWARVVLAGLDAPCGAERPSRQASAALDGDDDDDLEDGPAGCGESAPAQAERKVSSSRAQLRLGQLHMGFREALDADGFVLWRSFPPLGPSHLVLRQRGMPLRRLKLCRFTLKGQKLTPSHRYDSRFEARSYPAAASDLPPWAAQARDIINASTFSFMGHDMRLVDADWMSSRFRREDALLHALCERDETDPSGELGPSRVLAAALSTPFPAGRLLRSMVLTDHGDEVLYVDAIVATEKGAGYRLLHDLVLERRNEFPHRPLIVVLMAVCSSDVVACYQRWRFCYGGIIGEGGRQPRRVCNRIDRLQTELGRFETAVQSRWRSIPRPTEPSPRSPAAPPSVSGRARSGTPSVSGRAWSGPPSVSDEPELESTCTAASYCSNHSDG